MKPISLSTTLPAAIMLVLALAPYPIQANPEAPEVLAPSPALDPQEVVAAMLAALKKNSDEGIEELYGFSSPGNIEHVGTLDNFRQMIRRGFPDMLGLAAARMAPPLVDGSRAMVTVEIIGSDEQLHQYVFILSFQEIDSCQGCWMADAVVNGQHFSHPPSGPGVPPGYPELPGEADRPAPGEPYQDPA